MVSTIPGILARKGLVPKTMQFRGTKHSIAASMEGVYSWIGVVLQLRLGRRNWVK